MRRPAVSGLVEPLPTGEAFEAVAARGIDAEAPAVDFESEEREPVLEAVEGHGGSMCRQIGPEARADGLLPHPPEAQRVEDRQNQPAFGLEHAGGFAKRLVCGRSEVERMRERHQVERFGGEGQPSAFGLNALENGAQEPVVEFVVAFARKPLRDDAVRPERVELRRADLKGFSAEGVCRKLVILRRFPCMQDLALRRLQKVGKGKAVHGCCADRAASA